MFTLDNLKALLSKRGGVARDSKFATMISVPPALTGISKFSGLPAELNLACESTQAPGKSLDTISFRSTQNNIKIPGAGITYDDVTMVFLVTSDLSVRDFFEEWINVAHKSDTFRVGYQSEYASTIIVEPQYPDQTPGEKSFYLLDSYPVSMSALEFNQGTKDSYLKLTVTFTYSRYQYK